MSIIQAVDSSVAWIEELFTESKVIPSADNQHPSAVEAAIQPMCKEDRKHHRRRSSFKTSEEFTESFLSELNVSNVMDESMSVGTLSGADDVSVSSSTYVSGISSSSHSSNGSIISEECVDGSVSSSHPSLGSWVVDKTCLSTDDELESQEDEDDDYLCSFAFDYGGWDNNKKQPIWLINNQWLSSQDADFKLVETHMLDYFVNLELVRCINEDYTASQSADSQLAEHQMHSYFASLPLPYDLMSFQAHHLDCYGRCLFCIMEVDEQEHEIQSILDDFGPLISLEYQPIGRFQVCTIEDLETLFSVWQLGRFKVTSFDDDDEFVITLPDVSVQDTCLTLDIDPSQLTREQDEISDDIVDVFIYDGSSQATRLSASETMSITSTFDLKLSSGNKVFRVSPEEAYVYIYGSSQATCLPASEVLSLTCAFSFRLVEGGKMYHVSSEEDCSY